MGTTSRDELMGACKSANAMIEYLGQKALHHYCYKIYTCEERLDSWKAEAGLFLSDGSNWNDIEDGKRLNPAGAKTKRFGTCFSFSQSENVAMWMLYGGMTHTGVMVDFRRRDINSVLEAEEIHLGYWEGKKYIVVKTLKKHQFDLEISDVLYCSDPIDVVKRSDNRCDMKDGKLLESIGWRRKAYPWNYENECRLTVSVDNSLVPGNCNQVKIPINNVYDRLEQETRIYSSPNNADKMHQPSQLMSSINWDLCWGCLRKRTLA